ncbi:MAG: hypothetical protein K2M10_10480 [Muribaculaceae bacterium]|nr:hypothetical protein [Muribaculaceae bacterium]
MNEELLTLQEIDSLIDQSEDIPWWNTGIVHSQLRRSYKHDYKRPAVYMITVTKNESTPVFSILRGNPSLKDEDCFADVNDFGQIIIDSIRYYNRVNEGLINIRHYVVMPDHLHFTVRVLQNLRMHVGIYLSYLFKECSQRLWNRLGQKGESFFKKGYNDKILYNYEQWLTWDEYIADNPRRALLRQYYPQFYHRGIILDDKGNYCNSYGNTSLICYPDKVVVRYTSKRSMEDNRKRLQICRELAEEGWVLVSPFVHGMEKALWKEGMEKGWKMIRIVENAYEHRRHPSKAMHEYCSTGNLLIVSLRKIGERSSPNLSNREICMEMNTLAERIASDKWRY